MARVLLALKDTASQEFHYSDGKGMRKKYTKGDLKYDIKHGWLEVWGLGL